MKKDAFDSLINLDDSLSSIRKITCPVLVICAGNGFLIESGKELLSYNSNPLNRFRIIDGAGHFFNEEGIAEKLYCLSISWIKLCLDHQAETDSSKTEEPRKVTIH